jgi:protein TonB
VIAVAGTGAVLQQQANAQLQREIDALRQENRQIAVLQEENLNLKQTAAEVATLRTDDAELAQLGTEAAALKVRLQAQAKAQTARNAPAAVTPYVGQLYNLAQVDHIPAVLYQARPVYPSALAKNGITGEATISFVVDSQGNVRNVSTVKSTHAEFGTAAVEAVQKWKFQPGQKGGILVNTRMSVPVVFNLSKDGTPLPPSTWF